MRTTPHVSANLPALTPNGKRSELEPPNKQHGFKRSKLELRGPKNSLDFGTRSSRGVRLARLFALISNLTSQGAVLK
eukprot:13913054-Alexandrium_andersonii.AAC.1